MAGSWGRSGMCGRARGEPGGVIGDYTALDGIDGLWKMLLVALHLPLEEFARTLGRPEDGHLGCVAQRRLGEGGHGHGEPLAGGHGKDGLDEGLARTTVGEKALPCDGAQLGGGLLCCLAWDFVAAEIRVDGVCGGDAGTLEAYERQPLVHLGQGLWQVLAVCVGVESGRWLEGWQDDVDAFAY